MGIGGSREGWEKEDQGRDGNRRIKGGMGIGGSWEGWE